jgi:phosphoribosylanthranilate isomerase
MSAGTNHLIKICGLTTTSDVEMVVGAGADAVGFIFAPSKRQVTSRTARELSAAAAGARRIGVMRSLDDQTIASLVREVPLDGVQLHDEVSSALMAQLLEQGLVVWRVLADGVPLENLAFDALLLDNADPGSGVFNDFSTFAPLLTTNRCLLAGGLNPHNVAGVIATYAPYGVDVASGVEASPGIKDASKVTAFINAARSAFDEVNQ